MGVASALCCKSDSVEEEVVKAVISKALTTDTQGTTYYIPHIVRIQACYRGFRARKIYKNSLRHIVSTDKILLKKSLFLDKPIKLPRVRFPDGGTYEGEWLNG